MLRDTLTTHYLLIYDNCITSIIIIIIKSNVRLLQFNTNTNCAKNMNVKFSPNSVKCWSRSKSVKNVLLELIAQSWGKNLTEECVRASFANLRPALFVSCLKRISLEKISNSVSHRGIPTLRSMITNRVLVLTPITRL